MQDFKERYIAARRAVIAQDLSRLNPMQRKAAMTTEGPLLLLAGAGSGKTTVLIQRVYNLLTYGRGSDSDQVPEGCHGGGPPIPGELPRPAREEDIRRARRLCAVDVPRPWEIIAITFTNKAAGELKDRLAARLGPMANDVWASTFHSACVRILRRDIDRLGFDKDFTIYDTDDSKRVVRDILKEKNLDEKTYPPKSILSVISQSKDRYETPEAFAKRVEAANDWRLKEFARVYAAYEKKLRSANALDFDDIIFHTVTLLRQEPEVLQYYQRKFRYVLVDEYQDTNHLQYLLTSLLAGGYKNPLRGGRRRPVHLPVPGGPHREHPELRAAVPRRPDHPPGTELPLHPEHPGTRPTRSSATTWAGRERPSGPTTAAATW